MVFAPQLAAIRGIGAGIFTPFRRFGEGSVDQGAVPVDLIRAVQLGQQHSVQLDPDTGLVPGLQVIVAGPAAAAAQLGGQIVPGNPGLEDEQDAGEDLTVIQRLASGKTEAALGRSWQQRFESLPECIGNEQLHGKSSLVSGDQSPDHQAAARVPKPLIFSFFPNALSEIVPFMWLDYLDFSAIQNFANNVVQSIV